MHALVSLFNAFFLLPISTLGVSNNGLYQLGGLASDSDSFGQGAQQMPDFGYAQGLSDGNEQEDLMGQINNQITNNDAVDGLNNNINLGESMNTGQGIGQVDMASYEGLNTNTNTAQGKIGAGGLKNKPSEHKNGDDRQGIGSGTVQGRLTDCTKHKTNLFITTLNESA